MSPMSLRHRGGHRMWFAALSVVFIHVTLTAGSVTVEAALAAPLEKISLIGYAVDNAKIDFAPIKITRE